MKKILFQLFFVFFLISSYIPSPISAAGSWTCSTEDLQPITTDSKEISFTIDTDKNASADSEYGIRISRPGQRDIWHVVNDVKTLKDYVVKVDKNSKDGKLRVEKMDGRGIINSIEKYNFEAGTYYLNIFRQGGDFNNLLCNNLSIDVIPASKNSSQFCSASVISSNADGKIYPDTDVKIRVDFSKDSGTRGDNDKVHHIRVFYKDQLVKEFMGSTGGSSLKLEQGFSIGSYEAGGDTPYYIAVAQGDCNGLPLCTAEGQEWACSSSFTVKNQRTGGGQASGVCSFCPIDTYKGLSNPNDPKSKPICKKADGTDATMSTCTLNSDTPNCSPIYGCTKTFNYSNTQNVRSKPLCPAGHLSSDSNNCVSIPSGLGVSLPTNIGGLINTLLGVFLGIVGGIALLIIIIAGYRLMVSQGNPEKIQAARETLTAALVGFLFVIFSMVILQVIGYNILGIPGFGK